MNKAGGVFPNDFTRVMMNGYYFDCCVDLYFYDESGELVYILKTPEKGLKPDINVSGSIISGGNAVNSFISIKNLSYRVDIDKVTTIRCDMYYNGLNRQNIRNSLGLGDKMKGHCIDFTVLYAMQDGEPPDRRVRFECQIAARDYSHVSAPMRIDGTKIEYGKKLVGYRDEEKEVEAETKDEGTETRTKKVGLYKNTLLGFLVALAESYNANPKGYIRERQANYNREKDVWTDRSTKQPADTAVYKYTNDGSGYASYNIAEGGPKITSIVWSGVDAENEELKIILGDTDSTFAGIASKGEEIFKQIFNASGALSIFISTNGNDVSLNCKVNVLDRLDRHTQSGNTAFWKMYGGINDKYSKFFGAEFEGCKPLSGAYDGKSSSVKAETAGAEKKTQTVSVPVYEETENEVDVVTHLGLTKDNPININFVKSASKNIAVLDIKTMFDDRLFPECYCKIAGRLLMGKSGLGTGNLTSFYEQYIIFQIIGQIDFTFSTIDGGIMSFKSVQVAIENDDGSLGDSTGKVTGA